jgi:hypothetical protein
MEHRKIALKDGVYTGMSWDDYCAIDALNGSKLIHMRKSPYHYKFMLDNPEPPTPSMILGTATHRMILEPERVGDFAVWGELEQEKVRRGRVWDEFQEDHAGKMIVTKGQRDEMVGMAVAARKHVPIMKYANAKGHSEVTLVWTDPVSGRRMKGRIDKLIPDKHIIFDLKTCRSCDKYRFGGQAYSLGYHIKMAMYWNGYKTLIGTEPTMKLGAVESKKPHESAVYRITSDVLLQGFDELDALLRKLAGCEETNEWPAAEPDETELTLPTYAFTEQGTDDLSDLGLEG